MSSYEQKVEQPDDKYQYLCFAAEPYETIAFKIPNLEIDFTEGKYFDAWDKEKRKYTLQIFFKDRRLQSALQHQLQQKGPSNKAWNYFLIISILNQTLIS